MKSIIESVELKDGRELYVQISESGRVSLSFDGPEQSMQLWLTVHELKAYMAIANKALSQRVAQVNEELQNV